jgi:hypothetical protein
MGAVEKWDFEPKRQKHVFPFCHTRRGELIRRQLLHVDNFLFSASSSLGKQSQTFF